jgi:hypothetical protein
MRGVTAMAAAQFARTRAVDVGTPQPVNSVTAS